MLGALLERAKIPYQIYERAAKVKPLGKRKKKNIIKSSHSELVF